MSGPFQRTILLVRHGPTQWNLENRYNSRTDLPLLVGEDPNFESLYKIAERLGVKHVISSPQKRALETVELLRRGSSLLFKHCEVWTELRETDFGVFEGMTKDGLANSDLASTYSAWMDSQSTYQDAPDGESWNDIQSRIERTFSMLIGLPESTLVVSHGYFIRCLVGATVGLRPEAAARSIQTENYCVYRLSIDRDAMVKLASPLFCA